MAGQRERRPLPHSCQITAASSWIPERRHPAKPLVREMMQGNLFSRSLAHGRYAASSASRRPVRGTLRLARCAYAQQTLALRPAQRNASAPEGPWKKLHEPSRPASRRGRTAARVVVDISLQGSHSKSDCST